MSQQAIAEFPSPYGVTVIKSSSGYTIKGFTPDQFPSPYGVTVIKSKENKNENIKKYFVSVPLRGNGN